MVEALTKTPSTYHVKSICVEQLERVPPTDELPNLIEVFIQPTVFEGVILASGLMKICAYPVVDLDSAQVEDGSTAAIVALKEFNIGGGPGICGCPHEVVVYKCEIDSLFCLIS